MKSQAPLKVVTVTHRPVLVEKPRVCEIRRIPNDEHELLCILAWKRREHPEWSQHHVSFRITQSRKLKGVK